MKSASSPIIDTYVLPTDVLQFEIRKRLCKFLSIFYRLISQRQPNLKSFMPLLCSEVKKSIILMIMVQ